MKQRPNNWPKRVGAFLNNYRAVIFLAAAILLSSSAFSQVDTNKVVQYINAFGYRYKNIGIDSSLRVPADTFKLSFRDTSALAFKGKVLYRWSGTNWKPIASKVNDTTFIINGDTVRAGSGGSGGATNLSKSYTSTTFTITPSSGGTPVTIDPATTSQAGGMTAANKRALDSAIVRITPLNDSVLAYYNSKGEIMKLDTNKAFEFVLPLKVVGQSTQLDYDTNSLRIINNKLAAKITTVKNIGELRSLPSYDTSMIYRLIQNKVVGDFYFVSGCSDSDDSAMSISVTGGCLKRYTDGYITPEYFGGYPNDSRDDSYAFQKMFNYIANATVLRNYKVVIPGGRYDISTTVTLPQTLYNPGSGSIPRVEIEGYGATIFVTGAITAWKRTVADMTEANSAMSSAQWSFSGIEFTGSSTTGQKGLEFHATYGATFKDLRFTGLDTGFVARFILGSKFDNIFYTSNKSVGLLAASLNGVTSGATTSNSAFNANSITRNRVYSANGSYTGMMVLAADGVHIWNNIFEGFNPQYDIYFDSQGSTVVNGNTIEEAWFESSGGVYTVNTAMRLRVNGSMTIKNIQNDSQDTLFDWSNSAAGASFILDGVYYWNWPAKYIKGAPSSGLSFTVKNVPTAQIQNFVNSTFYNDGMPQDVLIPGTQLSGGLGVGIVSSIDQYIRPNPNGATNNRKLFAKANLFPEDDNTYDIGSPSLRFANLYVNTKGYFGATSNDGSGSKLQVGGAISILDGSQIFDASGTSFFRISTANGTEVGYGSGKVQMNPHLSYIFSGSEKFRVSSAGEVWINPAGVSDLGAFTLQNTGGLYQQGTFRLGGTVTATSPLFLLAKLGDSSVAEISFPGGTSNFLRADGTFAAPAGASYTFTNGLTNSSGTVSLGGALPNSLTQLTGGGSSSQLYLGGGSGLASTTIEAGTTQVIGAFATAGTHTITSGTSATVNNDVSRVVINPGSVIASYTLTLSATPVDGEEIMIFFGGTIAGGATVVTSLTISANSGQTLMQPTTPSTAVGGDCIIYKYLSSNSTWYRVK